ncbi:MAG: ATP-binding cassette domain-containing protein [Clostridiales bacterium]|jgi:ABC-type lipoprotein export system ATPase subunit|nr:ATP-binding cassette domain-containing protein [Clostridiales bacterium]
MNKITVIAGTDKNGEREGFGQIDMRLGEMYAVCGATGSGKSRLIKDIEMLVNRDSVTGRRVLIDDSLPVDRQAAQSGLIAHLGQNMRFMLDIEVGAFIEAHLHCRGNATAAVGDVLKLANAITQETVIESDNLNALSGGQSRALMIADIAVVCNSPIVLIDEIENAGIDKTVALKGLLDRNKLVLIVTHDPHIILMAEKRIIMRRGAVRAVKDRSVSELAVLDELAALYLKTSEIQKKLRAGESL